MANQNAFFSLEAQMATERDGFQDAVRFLRGSAGRQFLQADTLTVWRTGTSAKSDVITNAAVKPVLISVNSPATATTDAWLQLFNTSSASVTLGGLPQPTEIIKVPYAKTTTVVFFPGTDQCKFSAALSVAMTTTVCGGTAADATNAASITILYG
jgi:hypothetical protein